MREIILLSLVCISLHLNAQKSFFGVDAGTNIANQRTHIPSGFDGSGTHYYENSLKPTFGVFCQYGFNKTMGLRLNAQYMGLGYSDHNFRVDINYLTFPLTFHYSFNKRLSLNTGPYLSFTLGGTRLFNQPIIKTYHKNDHGLSFGGEYNFYKNLSFSINYIFGLKSILLDDTIRDANNNIGIVKVTNRALQLTLIYKFKKILSMKKYSLNSAFLFILTFTTINCFAQSEETYKIVAQETCDCITKDDITTMTKNQVQASLGLCMLQSIQKNKINIQITDAQAMRAFGQKVGALMAPICPAVFKSFVDEAEAESKNLKVVSIEGKVKSVEDGSLLYITLKDNAGNEQRVVWFSYFEGSDEFATDPRKLVGKNVAAQYRTIQCYMPKAKGYMSVKELVGLKLKD